MRFNLFVFLASTTFFVPALASLDHWQSIDVDKFDEHSVRYIVQLKSGVAKESFLEAKNISATHKWEIINGFACSNLDSDKINQLRAHEDVESIFEDDIVEITAFQTDAPWGLARLSSDSKLVNQDPAALNFSYAYNETDGSGVDIYVADTGVYVEHTQFAGRARLGAVFTQSSFNRLDLNGHGTHCAGIAAGSQFGVAKAASIIAVKVLGDNGKGGISDIISGLDYILDFSSITGRASIASLSFGRPAVPASAALDRAVTRLTAAGVHVIVAAGNMNVDAGTFSPARVPSAITVGASNISDSRTSFSNYGSVIDLFAPGQDIISSWIGNPNATLSKSGTSMAAPYISGLVASLISREGNISPEAMAIKVKSLDLKNVLSNIPVGTTNELAQNGFTTD